MAKDDVSVELADQAAAGQKTAPKTHRREVIPGRARPGQTMQTLYYDRHPAGMSRPGG